MIKSFTGHYDGKVLVLDKPVKLPVGKKLSIQVIIEPRAGNGKGRRRKIIGQGKFHSGISDLGSNKKHMEGFGREPSLDR